MGTLSSETSSYLICDDEKGAGAKWTREENKMFEEALALFDENSPDRWYNVAAMIPGKTVGDVLRQYRELVSDVLDIEAGVFPMPRYQTPPHSLTLEWVDNKGGYDYYKQFTSGRGSGSNRASDHERKKGVPWTEDEHRQFLLGLNKYGKGDWRNISRNFVTTRTPTQVASHAQKYFIRQHSGGKDRRRSSIHDITTVNLSETMSPSPSHNNNNNNNNNCPHHPQDKQAPQEHPAKGNGVTLNSPRHDGLVDAPFEGNSWYGLNLLDHNVHLQGLH